MLFFRKNEKHDMSLNHAYGHHMATEISQAREVFVKRLTSDIALDPLPQAWNRVYTIARGSSDAVATILSYEWMRVLNLPRPHYPLPSFLWVAVFKWTRHFASSSRNQDRAMIL